MATELCKTANEMKEQETHEEVEKVIRIPGRDWKLLEIVGRALIHVLAYGLYTIIAFLTWIAMKADYRWFMIQGNEYGSFMWAMGALFLLSFSVLLKMSLNDAENFIKLRDFEKNADDND
ncbi:MAG: hypothetical protein PWQ63_1683 [Methanolobus sp.]|nr:hypothetical protein [Methanolobus sp.]